MKKIKFFLILLLISNSLFIFGYGIKSQLDAGSYHRNIQESYLLDSALTLAIHYYEDNGRPKSTSQKLRVKNREIGYNIREINKDYLYIRVFVKKGGKKIEKEFMVNI